LLNILYAFKALKNNDLAPGHERRGFHLPGWFAYVFLFYL